MGKYTSYVFINFIFGFPHTRNPIIYVNFKWLSMNNDVIPWQKIGGDGDQHSPMQIPDWDPSRRVKRA